MFSDPMSTDPIAASPRRGSRRLAGRARACLVRGDLARERSSRYRTEATAGGGQLAPGAAERDGEDRSGAPFGVAVLGEVPELAELLTWLVDADRLAVMAVVRFAELADAGRAEQVTGVGLDHWAAAIARHTRLERATLRRVARLLVRLPGLRTAAGNGRVSFAQLRTLALRLRGVPDVVCAELDGWLAAAIDELPADADPDAIVTLAERAADELAPEVADADAQEVSGRRYLHIQPNLMGTGGRFHGEEDALGLAALEAATSPTRDQLGDVGRGRADNLQERLQHACADPVIGGDAAGAPAPVKLLLRWDLESLFDRSRCPAEMIVRLTGGRLRLDSASARRVLDERGAELRAIIVDQGRVVGVGRTARFARGWLRDALHALHDTCTEPLCTRPALGADADHATSWTPDGDDHTYGRTDLDELGPLCATTNRDKRASGWRTAQHGTAGIRTWTHARAGIAITSVPATWRPTSHRSPRAQPERSPPAPDDPLPF